MMYVNTYILAVPEEKKDEYVRIAEKYAEIAKDFGALEIFENWELEVPDGEQTDYRKAVQRVYHAPGSASHVELPRVEQR